MRLPALTARHRRSVAVAAAGLTFALLGGGLLALGAAGAGSGANGTVTTPKGPAIRVPKPRVAQLGGVLVGDLVTLIPGAPGVTVLKLPGARNYRLSVTNVSSIGYVNAFQWYPPSGVQIVRVTSSSAGRCHPSGTSGFGGNQFSAIVLNPNVVCTGLQLKPPSCGCRNDGGSMVVTFVTNRVVGGGGLGGGLVRVTSMTPILKIIPGRLAAQGVQRVCDLNGPKPVCHTVK